MNIRRAARGTAAMIAMGAAVGACSSTGGLGGILGEVLGGGGNRVSGTVRGIDTRAQRVFIQQSDGREIGLNYDSRTRVVYQNREYSVTNLENGDQVVARIPSGSNSSNYTDLIEVTRSVSSTTSGSGNVRTFEGNVRQVDQINGWFTVNSSGFGTLTVTLPYNPRRTDLTRFQNLRPGDFVRFEGVMLNNTRVELRQFF